MTNMKMFLKVLISCLLVIGCQNVNIRDKNQLVTFNLKELPKITTVKLSDLGFVDIEYIPLETNEQCLIQNTINLGSFSDKLIVNESSFIIRHYNTILKFKDNGTFVAKIGTEGRGPNEFQACHDVETNEKGEKIFIVDGFKKKLFIYAGNGDFIKTVNFPFNGFGYFRYIGGKFLCYTDNHLGNIKTSFNLIDTNGIIIKSFANRYPFFKPNNDAYGFNHENLFYVFNYKLFKKEVYSDTIYSFEDMNFKPHLVIKVGDKLMTTKARAEFAGIDLAKNFITPLNLFEFGDYVFYDFRYKFELSLNGASSEIYSFIGSKKNSFQALINSEAGLINDLDGGPSIEPLTIKNDKTIIACIDAIKLKSLVTSESFKKSVPKYPEKKKELEKLANSLKETDNPVLMLVRLKK